MPGNTRCLLTAPLRLEREERGDVDLYREGFLPKELKLCLVAGCQCERIKTMHVGLGECPYARWFTKRIANVAPYARCPKTQSLW